LGKAFQLFFSSSQPKAEGREHLILHAVANGFQKTPGRSEGRQYHALSISGTAMHVMARRPESLSRKLRISSEGSLLLQPNHPAAQKNVSWTAPIMLPLFRLNDAPNSMYYLKTL
jgi:hypothetical protein